MERNDKDLNNKEEEKGYDPFLNRIQLQGTVIRKWLAQIESSSVSEIDSLPDDNLSEKNCEQN
ncbi:MAG: hypothetical protein V1775_18670 [Bacteroidota bacterium]